MWYKELYKSDHNLGKIRLVEWDSKGLVLWVGSQIVWQSWVDEPPDKDLYRKLAEQAFSVSNELMKILAKLRDVSEI